MHLARAPPPSFPTTVSIPATRGRKNVDAPFGGQGRQRPFAPYGGRGHPPHGIGAAEAANQARARREVEVLRKQVALHDGRLSGTEETAVNDLTEPTDAYSLCLCTHAPIPRFRHAMMPKCIN